MKNILVPTDFSDCAYAAVQTAADIARRQNAKIRLLHVYERPIYGFVDMSVDHEQNRRLKAEIQDKFDVLLADPIFSGIEMATSLAWDTPVWEAVNQEDFANHDLIVMGTHGASGFKEIFIGSNAEKVVRASTIPVLTIAQYSGPFDPTTIAFASNFFREVEPAFAVVNTVRKLFNAKIMLLKINTPGNFESTWYSEKIMHEFAESVGLDDFSTHIYNDENVEKGILNFSTSNRPDVIAIATHGRTGLLHLINGSIAESVVNHFDMPVLSIRLKDVESPTGVIFPY